MTHELELSAAYFTRIGNAWRPLGCRGNGEEEATLVYYWEGEWRPLAGGAVIDICYAEACLEALVKVAPDKYKRTDSRRLH